MMSGNDKKRPKGDYPVGFGKPPVHSRFKPGQKSANPKGRPKKDPDFGQLVREHMAKPVTVTEGDRRVQRMIKEILLTQITNKALQGDAQARRDAIGLLERHDVRPAAPFEETEEVKAQRRALSAKLVEILQKEASRKKRESASYKARVAKVQAEHEQAQKNPDDPASSSED